MTRASAVTSDLTGMIGPRLPALAASLVACAVLAQAQPEYQEAWQLALLELDDGDTLRLPTGTYQLTESLLVDGLDDIVIEGAGRGATVLQFGGQRAGAEGLKVSNCDRVTLRGFTVLDTAGDAIKAQGCAGITFADVETSWTGKPAATNGSYGLYPVQCSGVLIEGCRARGASDAGIYVGQSRGIVVRDCHAVENVAGIEIENSTDAEVYGNLAEGNTGGILVFDLPGLIVKAGGRVRVHGNRVLANNLGNFAPAGNIVASVPPGTGVMVLATSDVEVYDNDILDHRTTSVAVVSYHITELPIGDPDYDPIPHRVRVTGNRIARQRQWPALKPRIGKLLAWKFGRRVPPLLYDGITRETLDGRAPTDSSVCFADNGADWALLDAARGFAALARNPPGLVCDDDGDDSDDPLARKTRRP